MENNIPISKWQRSIAGGKTVAKVGGEAIKYYTKRPFLSMEKQREAKTDFSRQSAGIVFQGMSLLKGTALKIAQQLSLELDIFPSAVHKELEKSYNQVPPINRALIRKIIRNAFGHSPEAVFKTFEPEAFAAASLGQVHRAETHSGRKLAVKVQYPGIRETIRNDIQLMKRALRPLPEYNLIQHALNEIENRLVEETEYRREADHINYFATHLNMEQVQIPDVDFETTTDTVLSITYMEGAPLNEWLEGSPTQPQRDAVAQLLNDIFFKGLYKLSIIHADPNPGNFIIQNNLRIGLIDFGCVKKLDPEFVKGYCRLVNAAASHDQDAYFQLLKQLNLIKSDPVLEAKEKIYKLMNRVSLWLGKLYQEEVFDFGANKNFMREGRDMSRDMYELGKHMDLNPNFIFLDRTRYGLLRLFERMEARVRIRNPYEWPEE